MNHKIILILLATALGMQGCQQENAAEKLELARLQKEVLAKQDLLLNIHLDLDSAAREISEAQANAGEGNCSGAEFHADEAYRKLRDADDSILILGRDLQAMFNLDMKKSEL